jgi:DNA primase
MGIRQESIDEVRGATKIEEIVEADVVLKPAGTDSLKGLCPFHEEKTPSFHVRPAMQRWYCFSCAEGGDVISYIMKKTGADFTETLETLADRAGITLEYDNTHKQQAPTGPRPQRLREANAAAAAWFTHCLKDRDDSQAKAARDFIVARRIPPATALEWGAGYAPNHPRATVDHLRGQGFTTEELVAAGLIAPNGRGGHRPAFRGRLTWAIRDATGQVIGFGARRLDDVSDWGPKFLNTVETPLYHKGRALFGIHLARKPAHDTKTVYVVEGYTDVVAAHLAGITTTVAACGTALTEEHLTTLHRTVGTDGLIALCLDGDEAGHKASRTAFELTQKVGHTRVNIVSLPAGQDPNDILVAQGPQALATAMTTNQTPITPTERPQRHPQDSATTSGTIEREIITALIHDEATASWATSQMGLTPQAFATSTGRALMSSIITAMGATPTTPWPARLESATDHEHHAALNACLCDPTPRAGTDLSEAIRWLMGEASARSVTTAPITTPQDLNTLAQHRKNAVDAGAL